jgi:hypothetical protein
MKVSMLKNRAGWPAHLDHGTRAAALTNVVVVDHGVLERLHEAALDVNQVAVFTAYLRPSRPPSRGRRILGVRPSVEIVPKPYAPDTASLRAAARDQVCSECHYSPTQGSACKFPIRCTCPRASRWVRYRPEPELQSCVADVAAGVQPKIRGRPIRIHQLSVSRTSSSRRFQRRSSGRGVGLILLVAGPTYTAWGASLRSC